MKPVISMLTLLLWQYGLSMAQQNVELLSNVHFDIALSDVWGFEKNGKEYALVGLRNGISIVEITNPKTPRKLISIPGPASGWRDIKVWKDFAYITNESGGGVLVVDLSEVPQQFNWTRWSPVLPGGDTIHTCHNIFIDEQGLAFLIGSNANEGGTLLFDINANPLAPEYAGQTHAVYAHDAYARNDTLINAEIYNGTITFWDIRDRQNPKLLAWRETPFLFPHNAWLSDDGNYLYTTDEKPEAYVAAFDISELDDIKLADTYRPPGRDGYGVLPHNVFANGDYLYISYYTEGVKILDARKPNHLIAVGSYDTDSLFRGGFSGAWGVYPFLPSGNILVSDRDNGLFVLKPILKKASRISGTVINTEGAAPISNAMVRIVEKEAVHTTTNFRGEFKLGVADTGSYTLEISARGYFNKVYNLDFDLPTDTTLRISLQKKPVYKIEFRTKSKAQKLSKVNIRIKNTWTDTTLITTDNAGAVSANLPQGNYDVFIGKWGYLNQYQPIQLFDNQTLVANLDTGYEDNFSLALGWEVRSTASEGGWERGQPTPTYTEDFRINNPGLDSQDDGPDCYVTGLNGGIIGKNDVDNGCTRLYSPWMNWTTYLRPGVTLSVWFNNHWGTGPPDDTLIIQLATPIINFVIGEVYTSQTEWHPKLYRDLPDLERYDSVRLIVQVCDTNSGNYNILEAGIDNFKIIETFDQSRLQGIGGSFQARLYPNPLRESGKIYYTSEAFHKNIELQIFDVNGRVVYCKGDLPATGVIQLPGVLLPGVYYYHFIWSDGHSDITAFIKM